MRGRLVTTVGVSLSTRAHREADRITVLFTADFGKVPVRFIAVERPRGKLKALAEPMVLGEYRLHVRDGADSAIATGGVLHSVFPAVRRDVDATLRGLEICELLDRMTPSWKPAPEKLALATDFLTALDRAAGSDSQPSASTPATDVPVPGRRTRLPTERSWSRGAAYAWIANAFALRLFEAAGFGLRTRRVSEGNRELWERLHAADVAELACLPPEPDRQGRLEALIGQTVERLTHRRLRSPGLLSSAGRHP